MPSDGLPGIFGWGKKSAAALLRHYRHIEVIPDEASEWGVRPRRYYDLASSLREESQRALLYRQLATLRLDVPLEETLEGLAWRGARRKALSSLCRELEDEGLLERVRWFWD